MNNKERQECDLSVTFNLKLICCQDHDDVMLLSKVYLQTSKKPGLDILGQLSHQMSSASIVGNIYFHATR